MTPAAALRLLRWLDQLEARAALLEEMAAADGIWEEAEGLEAIAANLRAASRLRDILRQKAAIAERRPRRRDCSDLRGR